MNRRLTKFMALTLIMAMAIGIAGCSKVEDLFALHHDTNPKTNEATERLEINTDETLTYPDHVATAEEVHPERAPGEVTGQEASDLLNEVEDAVLHETISNYADIKILFDNPEAAGFTYDVVSWGEVSLTDEEDIEFVQDCLDDLYSINYEELNEQDRIFYDKIVWDLEERAYSQQFTAFPYYESYFNPLVGIQTEIEFILEVFTFDTIQNAEEYIELVIDTDRYFDDICTFEEARAAYGFANSPDSYESMAASFDALLANEDDCFLYESFVNKLENIEGITDEQKADLIARHEAAMHEYFFGEMSECADRMRALKEYNGADVGVCEFPGGDDYFAQQCRLLANSNKSVETLAEELDTVFMSLYNTMVTSLQNPNFDFAGYMNASFSVGDVNQNLDFLADAISEDFPALPEHSYMTMEVPEALQENFSPAAYLGYHLDRNDQNLILTNPSNLDDLFGTTCAHEGYPGHMYQSVYSRNVCEHPYMYLSASIGYKEGWASYVQYYSYRYFNDSADVVNMKTCESLLDFILMARVDIGINAEGWTLDDCSEYIGTVLGVPMEASSFEVLYNLLVLDPCYSVKYGCSYVSTGMIITSLHNEFPDATDYDIFEAYLNAQPGTFEQIESNARAALS